MRSSPPPPLTDDKIHDCQNILLSDEFAQDPSNNLFEISLMNEDYRTSSKFHCYINIVEKRIISAPATIECKDDSGVHEFDREMKKIFIGLSHELVVDRLIINFKVRITRSGYSTYTDNKHQGIRSDILTRTWGVVLDK